MSYFSNFCWFAAGTQTSGDSSRMEFAQDGFSAAFTSYVNKYAIYCPLWSFCVMLTKSLSLYKRRVWDILTIFCVCPNPSQFCFAFFVQGSVLMSAVGAFQWKGGYQEYLPDYSFQTGIEHESYLGEDV